MAGFVKIARKDEIPEDTGKYVEINGREIALFKVGGKIYAIDHTCPHAGGPLAEGGLTDKKVTCPWHGWEFDVTSGLCTFNKEVAVAVFKVQEKGDDVYVQV